MSECRPVGQALPPRRTVAASLSVVAEGQRRQSPSLSDSIIIDQARDRLWDSFERQLMPQEVKQILTSTISGDMHQWQKLFQAMFDSWPMLQKCLAELQRDVKMAPWKVKAYSEQGEKATPGAEQLSKDASRMLWGCRPRPAYAEGGIEFLMEGMVSSYFTGIGVYEPRWENIGGEWRPMAYKPLSALFYGYSNFTDGEDRLMLNRNGGYSNTYEDFDDHRFIIGIHGGHPGHSLVSAPLRVLTGYWLAAVFGLEWFMKFANLFGIPFRWATYSEDKEGTVKAGLVEMMKNLGSAGWGVGVEGTKIEFPLNQTQSANSLPQYELIKLADEQCVLFMLGQSLTTKVSSDGGSRSLGDIHADVKQGVVRGICDFVGDKITHQVIPAWSFWNRGDVAEDLPEFYPEWPEPKDEKAKAETLATIVNDIAVPVSEAYVYEQLGIPIPPEGEKLFVKGGATEIPLGKSEPVAVAAADASDTLEGLFRKLRPIDDVKVAEELEKAAKEGLAKEIAGAYNPSQPRDPGGDGGGQWTKEGSDKVDNSTHLALAEDPDSNGQKLQRILDASMVNIPAHSVVFRRNYGNYEVSVYGVEDRSTPKVVALLSTKADSIHIDTVEAAEGSKGKGYGKALYLAVARYSQENFKDSITGSSSEDAIFVRKSLFPTVIEKDDDLVFAKSIILPGINYAPKSLNE